MGRRFVPEHHADQFHAVPLRAGDHTETRRVCITGLDSHQILIAVGSAGEQFYFRVLQLFIGHMVVGQNMKPGRHGNPAQQFVSKKSLADHGKIISGGIVVFIRQAVGIDKIRIHASQLRRPLVHNLSEVLPVGAGDMLRHREGHLVGGTDQNGIQAVLHGKLLPHIHGYMIAVRGSVINGIPGKSHPFVQRTPLGSNQGSENLGGAGGILPGMNVFGIENGAGLRLDQNGRTRRDHRACGPARNLVALHRHTLLCQNAFLHSLRRDRYAAAKQNKPHQQSTDPPPSISGKH